MQSCEMGRQVQETTGIRSYWNIKCKPWNGRKHKGTEGAEKERLCALS